MKREVLINVDVHGTWKIKSPYYRIYINNEMIVERAYLAQENQFYTENILVNLEPGTHSFKFEAKNVNDERRVEFKNFCIDRAPAKLEQNQFTVLE